MKWDLSRGHAYRLIDSAKVIDAVSPMGDIHPTSERQARLLARLDPDQQREAWQKAVETAPGEKVTARHVESVVSEMKGAGKIRPAAGRSTWGIVGSHDRVNHKRALA